MKWKQFFTPVTSVDWQQAKQMVEDNPDQVLLLDVRQPKEYDMGHLPGATLIPMTEIDKRLHEIDPDKPTIIY